MHRFLVTEASKKQVEQRFESKAFKQAVAKTSFANRYGLKEAYEEIKSDLQHIVPRDIDPKYKIEALDVAISIFLTSPKLYDEITRDFMHEISQFLESYYQIKQAAPHLITTNIYDEIKQPFDELYEYIDTLKQKYDNYTNKREDKQTTNWEDSIVYNDAKYSYYVTRRHGDAIQLGKGTEWCTKNRNLPYYNNYTKKGKYPLIIVIDKTDSQKRYQLTTRDPYIANEKDYILPIVYYFYFLNKVYDHIKDKLPDKVERALHLYNTKGSMFNIVANYPTPELLLVSNTGKHHISMSESDEFCILEKDLIYDIGFTDTVNISNLSSYMRTSDIRYFPKKNAINVIFKNYKIVIKDNKLTVDPVGDRLKFNVQHRDFLLHLKRLYKQAPSLIKYARYFYDNLENGTERIDFTQQ